MPHRALWQRVGIFIAHWFALSVFCHLTMNVNGADMGTETQCVSAVIKVTCCDFGMENRWEFNSCQVNGTCCITLSCVSHDVPPLSCKSTSCCAIYKPLTPPAHSNLLYFVYIPFLIWGLICGSYLMWEGYLIKCKFFSFYDILWVYFVDL